MWKSIIGIVRIERIMTGSSLVSVAWDKPNEGLDWRVISVLSPFLIKVEPYNFEDVSRFVQRNARTLSIYCDCSALNSCDQVVALLNAGCVKVFVSKSLFQALLQDSYSHAHLDRLVLFLSRDIYEDLDKIVEGFSQEAEPRPNLAGSLDAVNSLRARNESEDLVQRLYVFLPDSSTADATRLLKEGYNIVIPSSRLSVQAKSDNCLEAHRLITDVAQSDRPDGLVPTIVVTERGESLGLVYSSRESIAMAIELSRGVYYSRSRNGLWIKGEESGNTQQLLRITLDCDADTLQFKVKQSGKGSPPLSPSFSRTDSVKDFVICKQRRALALSMVSLNSTTYYRIVRKLHRPDRILPGYFKIQIY